jgi:hypothetical protein
MWLDRIDAHTKNITVHTYMYINRWIIPTVYITDLMAQRLAPRPVWKMKRFDGVRPKVAMGLPELMD